LEKLDIQQKGGKRKKNRKETGGKLSRGDWTARNKFARWVDQGIEKGMKKKGGKKRHLLGTIAPWTRQGKYDPTRGSLKSI